MDLLISKLLSESIFDFGKWSNWKYTNTSPFGRWHNLWTAPKAKDLKFERWFHSLHLSMSCVTCHVSHVTCHMSCVTFSFSLKKKIFYIEVKLVGGGSVITPSSLIALISSLERLYPIVIFYIYIYMSFCPAFSLYFSCLLHLTKVHWSGAISVSLVNHLVHLDKMINQKLIITRRGRPRW